MKVVKEGGYHYVEFSETAMPRGFIDYQTSEFVPYDLRRLTADQLREIADELELKGHVMGRIPTLWRSGRVCLDDIRNKTELTAAVLHVQQDLINAWVKKNPHLGGAKRKSG